MHIWLIEEKIAGSDDEWTITKDEDFLAHAPPTRKVARSLMKFYIIFYRYRGNDRVNYRVKKYTRD